MLKITSVSQFNMPSLLQSASFNSRTRITRPHSLSLTPHVNYTTWNLCYS